MNFDLSEDESLLKSLAERFVADRYDLERRRAYLAEREGFSRENWALLGEIGLIATAFGADSGGMGAGPVETIILHEALGRGLIVEPLIDCAVVAGGLFERVAGASLRAAWMPDLVTGARRLALAHRERRARGRIGVVEAHARRDGDGWSIAGGKAHVLGAVGADALIVSAREHGGADDPAGVRLFLVPASAPGVTIAPYRVIDGTVAAVVTFADARVPGDAVLDGDLTDLIAAETRGDLARAAEALGLMELLMSATLDHLRTRKQFGQALGSFQALQHRMVAQYVAVEQARGLLLGAAMADGNGGIAGVGGGDGARAVAGARAFIAEASIKLGHEAIQLHGGMGVSDEMVVGHAHRRLFALSRHPGDAAAALDRFAGLAA